MSIAEHVSESTPIIGELVTNGMKPILYSVSDAKIAELREQFSGLTVLDAKDYDQCTRAISVCRGLRSDIEKCRKDLKQESLEYGRRVDSEAKRLTTALEKIEEPLKEEKQRFDEAKERAKREEEERVKQALNIRLEKLKAVGALVNPMIVSEWSDDEFDASLAKATEAFEAEKIRVQEEEARKAKEEAERKEQIRLEKERIEAERAELAKLRAEQAERERVERERVEAEQKEAQAKLQAERAELDRMRAEQEAKDAAERSRVQAEQKAESDRLEAERKALQAEKDRMEAERAEAARAKEIADAEEKLRLRREAMAPDAEKLRKFAQVVRDLALPDMSTDEGKDFIDNVKSTLEVVAIHCESF